MVAQSTLFKRFNGISAESATKTANAGERETLNARRREAIPWIASPLKYADGDNLHFYRHEDATTIELFFDLFFVANLTTFTIVHEINDHKCILNPLKKQLTFIKAPNRLTKDHQHSSHTSASSP
ncbi:MAG: hypothetical protein M1836_004049 [Candelina mexicana]|nr:MAG: hypothetical protein M1836_004049 [Candelina mexicana]